MWCSVQDAHALKLEAANVPGISLGDGVATAKGGGARRQLAFQLTLYHRAGSQLGALSAARIPPDPRRWTTFSWWGLSVAALGTVC